MLPGALMQNTGLKFLGKTVDLSVDTSDSVFTNRYIKNLIIALPIAHQEGNYTIDKEVLTALHDQDRLGFTYCKNPNGAVDDIFAILFANRRILGLMHHPERAIDPLTGELYGQQFFAGLASDLVSA